MTDTSNEHLDKVLADAAKATPGKWLKETETQESIDECDDRQQEVYVCSQSTVCNETVVATMGKAEAIPQAIKQANATHIANCAPEFITALCNEIKRLRAKENG